MPVVWSPDSKYAKEMDRWNRPRNQMDENGVPGMNAVGYEPFPKMVYMARKLPNGQFAISDPIGEMSSDPTTSLNAASFGRSCCQTVYNQHEFDRAEREGWSSTPTEALAKQEGLQLEIARAAAEANFGAARMSEKGRREWEAAHDTTEHHVVDVKGKKRGRKPKVVAPADPEKQ